MKVMILQGHQEWQRHSTMIMIEFQIGFSALYVPCHKSQRVVY